MKAAVFEGNGKISVRDDYPAPVPGEDSVLIRVRACGVCGTDSHIFSGAKGATECKPPIVLGHELAGVVEKVGSAVTRVKPGDHVTVDPNISCGACSQCRRGNPHFCDSMSATGVNHDGGFAQYCVALERQVFVLPESVPFEEAALCEPVACCLHGIDLCGVKAGDDVLIVGGGSIGMIMLQLALMSGAARVALLEINEDRFELARSLGATLTLNPLEGDAEAELKRNGFDDIRVVIECAGSAGSVQSAIRYAGKAATVMIFSLTAPDCAVPFLPFKAFQKELTLKTSFVNPHTQGRAAGIIASGRLRLRELISDRIALDDITDAFAPGSRGGKVIVLP